jgi:hypothetical protein
VVVRAARARVDGAERQWHVQLALAQGEARRHHTDDGARLSIRGERPPHDRRIAAEAALPVAVAQHHHLVAPGPVLGGGVGAAEQRWRLEGGEELRRRVDRVEVLGLPRTRDRHVAVAVRGDALERRQRGDVRQLRVGEPAAIDPLPLPTRVERDEVLRRGIREGTEQHAVDDAEDRRGGPDPNGQRRDHHRREPGGPPESAPGVAKVLPQRVRALPVAHAILPSSDGRVKAPARLVEGAEAPHGLGACGVGGHAASDECLDPQVEVERDLLVHLGGGELRPPAQGEPEGPADARSDVELPHGCVAS